MKKKYLKIITCVLVLASCDNTSNEITTSNNSSNNSVATASSVTDESTTSSSSSSIQNGRITEITDLALEAVVSDMYELGVGREYLNFYFKLDDINSTDTESDNGRLDHGKRGKGKRGKGRGERDLGSKGFKDHFMGIDFKNMDLSCATISKTLANNRLNMSIDFGSGCSDGTTNYVGKVSFSKTYPQNKSLEGISIDETTGVATITQENISLAFADTIVYENFGTDSIVISGTEIKNGTVQLLLSYSSDSDDHGDGDHKNKLGISKEVVSGESSTVTNLSASFIQPTKSGTLTLVGSIKGSEDATSKTIQTIALDVKSDINESMSIRLSSPLIRTESCEENGARTFVSGTEVITWLNDGAAARASEIIINFGSGDCDNLVTVTQDGVATEYNLDTIWENNHCRKDD